MTRGRTKSAGNLDRYLGDARDATARGPETLRTLRAAAIEHFAELGFPTTRLEEWRDTNVSMLAKTPHALVLEAPALSATEFERLKLPDFGGDRLVFVDGFYAHEHSRRSSDDEQVEIATLRAEAAKPSGAASLTDLLTPEDYKDDAFAALNFASCVDDASIRIRENSQLAAPIQVIFVSTARAGAASANHPRLHLRAEPNSRAMLVQDHVSLDDGEVLTNVTSRVEVEDDAQLEWILVQREGERARHIGRQRLEVARNARAEIHTFNFDGEITRNDLAVVLGDEHAESAMKGLAMGTRKQRFDNHTRVDHAVPNCTSRQLYKAALAGDSKGSFRGRIVVRPDAQRSDAEQQSKTLLLSNKAGISTKPQLEIYADDVKCSHGASIGQLDPDALFFLRSRGLDRARAYALLTQGFASEITEAISREDVREWLWASVLDRLDSIAARESGR